MDALDLLVPALAGLTVLLWLIAPLLIRLTFRHDASPTLAPCETWEVPDLPAEFLDSRAEELEMLGFADCGRASFAAERGGVLWFALLRNDLDQHMACISVATLLAAGERRLQMGQVELATVWPDGREILTSNLAQAIAIDPLPEHDLLQVPDEQDLGLLLRIHKARVARQARGRPSNPSPGEELGSVEEVFHRTLEHQVERGWFWKDEARAVYRATLRGAWRMTNRLLFPYAQIARWRIARRAKAALAGLGFQPPVI